MTTRKLLFGLGALLLSACGTDATSTVERGGSFELLQGPPAIATPGYPVVDSIKVRLVDRDGAAMRHIPVYWFPGTGSVSGAVETDADGIAAVVWTLGDDVGTQSLTVRTLQDSVLTVSTTAEFFRAERLSTRYAGGCAVRSGELWCWGEKGGIGFTSPANVSRFLMGNYYYPVNSRPVRITQEETFVDVRVTFELICGLRSNGTVGCIPGAWGTTPPTVEPLNVPPLRQLSGGGTFQSTMCGLAVNDSTPWCWNGSRQPAQVANVPALIDLGGVGGSNPSNLGGCGRQADSTVHCWGATSPTINGAPILAAQVTVDATDGCARLSNAEVWCWPLVSGVPAPASKVAEGVSNISSDHSNLLGVRNGRLIRWPRPTAETWSMTPVPTVAARLFGALPANAAYGIVDASGAVFVGGEHYFTNNSGYYNGEYWPLQPVED